MSTYDLFDGNHMYNRQEMREIIECYMSSSNAILEKDPTCQYEKGRLDVLNDILHHLTHHKSSIDLP